MISTPYDAVLHVLSESNNQNDMEFISYIKHISIIEELLPFILKHRVQNIFWNYLVNHQLTYLVDRTTYKLFNHIVTASTLSIYAYEQLFRTLHENLESAGVPYAVVKGFHLNNSIYANKSSFALRDYNDIDILVDKANLEKVNRILKLQGFIQGDINRKTLFIEPCNRKEHIDMLLNTHQQYQNIRPGEFYAISHYNIQLIDVNFSIWEGGNQPDNIPTNDLLRHRLLNVTSTGIKYWSLLPQYDLIQLCYHFFKDTIYEIKKNDCLKLIHLYDIYLLLQSYHQELSIDELFTLITSANIEDQIYYVIALIKDIFLYQNVAPLLLRLSPKISPDIKSKIESSLQAIRDS